MGMVVLLLAMVAPGAVAQGPDGGGGGGGRFGDPQQFIDNNDTNKDGKVTAEEFQGPPQLFGRLDTNSDGSVTAEEVTAAREQFGQQRQRQGGQGGQGGFGNFQQRRLDRIKEQMSSTDEEWSVLQPRIEKVFEAQVATFRGFGRGRRGGGGGGGDQDQPAEVQTLTSAVEKKDASADELTAALKAYREYVKKGEADLNAAREDLRKIVTPRQEAVLVLNGVLD
jgi:hypothetical protein